MALTKLGKYLALSDLRNSDGKLGSESVVGLSTQKQIILTKASLDGVSLTSYKLFPPKHYAYVPDTSRRGDKMSLGYNTTKNTFLVSSISVVFFVSDTDNLLEDYLYMYFNRTEFDRYAHFNSWGSAREAFSWEDMCDIDIDLPPLPVQRKYVDIYNAMLANQRAYENGLEDLNVAISASVEEFKHTAPRVAVGSLLEEIDVRNHDGAISYEEKAFYDILVKVRDDHGFPYADDKCLVLAKKIKDLIDDKAQFADWSTRDDIKNQLNMDLTVLLYKNGYPPEWDEEVFDKVMEQAENFKKYNG